MDKAAAKRNAAALAATIKTAQEDLAKLQEIIDAPDPVTSLLTKPVPESGAAYWVISALHFGCLGADAYRAHAEYGSNYTHGNLFQAKALAEAYADAINTMLLLRHQPGTEPAQGKTQHMVEVTHDCGTMVVRCVARTDMLSKLNKISPCFATREDADTAVATVGSENILRMFRVFHHNIN